MGHCATAVMVAEPAVDIDGHVCVKGTRRIVIVDVSEDNVTQTADGQHRMCAGGRGRGEVS